MGKKADTEKLRGHRETCSWESSGSWRSSVIEKHRNKQSPNYNPSPCEVIDRNRGKVTLRKKDDVEVKRNVSFVEKYQENATSKSESVVPLQPIASPSESVTPLQPIAIQPIPSPISIWQAVNPSSPMLKASPRPTRTVRLPKRFDDYELSKVWLDFVTGGASYSCTLFTMLWNWT